MSEAPWQESHLDSEGNEIEREPVGARGLGRTRPRCSNRSAMLGVPEGDLRRERLRPLPGGPHRDPPGKPAMSRGEFYRWRQDEKYTNPGSRCP